MAHRGSFWMPYGTFGSMAPSVRQGQGPAAGQPDAQDHDRAKLIAETDMAVAHNRAMDQYWQSQRCYAGPLPLPPPPPPLPPQQRPQHQSHHQADPGLGQPLADQAYCGEPWPPMPHLQPLSYGGFLYSPPPPPPPPPPPSPPPPRHQQQQQPPPQRTMPGAWPGHPSYGGRIQELPFLEPKWSQDPEGKKYNPAVLPGRNPGEYMVWNLKDGRFDYVKRDE